MYLLNYSSIGDYELWVPCMRLKKAAIPKVWKSDLWSRMVRTGQEMEPGISGPLGPSSPVGQLSWQPDILLWLAGLGLVWPRLGRVISQSLIGVCLCLYSEKAFKEKSGTSECLQ